MTTHDQSTDPDQTGDAALAGLNPANPDPLLDVQQVGNYLGTGARYVRRMIQERRITVTFIAGSARIRLSALEAFIAANTRPAERSTPKRRAKDGPMTRPHWVEPTTPEGGAA